MTPAVDPLAPTQPPPRALEPAVVVTVYGDLAGTAALPILDRVARVAAPGDLAVCIHDPPGDDERRLADVIRARGWRLWYAWGVDPDVRRPIRDAAQITRRRARLAADRGAEVVELNGEAAWRAEDLATQARVLIEAAREGAPDALVSWTSFDHVLWHHLPWGAILGPGGVDLHAPQIYGADPGAVGPEGHQSVRARMRRAGEQIASLVRQGVVRPELAAGGVGWTPYGQLHGMTAAGVAVVLDAADVVRAWAIPTRCDPEGILSLEAVLLARRETGRRAGALARLQAAHGLDADGVLGEQTLDLIARLRG